MKYREILFGDLILRYRAGERDFSGVAIKTPFPERYDWDNWEFKGLDLSGIILRDSYILDLGLFLNGIIFREADLTNVDLGECNFAGADFSNAIMHGVQFWQSEAERANFSGADLTNASIMWTSFSGGNMI